MAGIVRKFRKWLKRKRAVPVTLVSKENANTRFATFAQTGEITLLRNPIFRQSDVFFTLGSCFAEEIRIALTARGIACVPTYRNIDFDPSTAIVDELPHREHMNFYNTFTVRLQLEQMFGLWTQADDDYWTIKRPGNPWDSNTAYQDPYRRLIIGRSPEVLHKVISDLNQAMLHGFEAATAFIFTFGMTEVFINTKSGKVAAQKPSYKGGGGDRETRLHLSSFEENLRNVLAIVDLIQSKKKDCPIILTVSPVSLSRTFQENDVIVVNTESKSILRAVLGQVARERKNVIYLPSYDFVTARGYEHSYQGDRRHVLRPVVDRIVGQFFEAYFIK